MGPRRGEDDDHAAHPAAGRRGRRAHAGAHGRCASRAGRGRADLRAGVRLRPRRRPSGRWSTTTGTRADATGAGQTIRLQTDMALGIEGDRVRARHVLAAGRAGLLRAVLGRGAWPRPTTSTRPTRGSRRPTRFWRDWLGAGPHPRPPLARADPALGAGDQGPDLHADRRDRRRADDVAAGDARAASATGTTATPGCATRRSRCRRCTTSTSTGRPTSSCSSSPTSSRTRTARCRSCTGSTAAAT